MVKIYRSEASKTTPGKWDFYAISLSVYLPSKDAVTAQIVSSVYAMDASQEVGGIHKSFLSGTPVKKKFANYAFKVTEGEVITYLNGKEMARISTSAFINIFAPMRVSYRLEAPEIGESDDFYAWSSAGLKPQMTIKSLEFVPGDGCTI